MDDFHRKGFRPRRGIPDDFHDHFDLRRDTNLSPKKQQPGRCAAELGLPHEILSALSRRGSHPSEWVLIHREEALYNLRTSEHIAIFRRTRPGWEPLKALNGVPTGAEIIALRRRTIPEKPKYGGAQTATEQFNYDNTVRQVFFHRSLPADASPPPGYQVRHISLREWDRIMATAVPEKPASHWVGLVLRDADGQPAAGYAYRLCDSSGVVQRGQLNAQGESQLYGLADGPVDITFGQPVEEPSIQAQRRRVRQALERLLQAEREEAARIESAQQQRSLLGKAMAYKRALSQGTGEALWGLLSGLKELSDLSTQHLNHALGAAWETWCHGDERRYLQTFLEHFKEAEFQELVDVLGIDPRSITREQWAEAQSLLNFLWHDEETRALLIDFANAYIDAQHGLELAEAGAGMLTEIAVDILITALTLGMGAALAVTTKVRHANKLGGLGKALKQLAQKLKQKAGSKRARSQTGTWLYEDLEKPGYKTIEARDGSDRGGYDGIEAPDKNPLGGRGSASGWDGFDETLAGGPVRDLTIDNIRVSQKGISVVEKHTGRFGFDEANQVMIDRLKRIDTGEIQATAQDLSFYSHELREFARYRRLGYETGAPASTDAATDLWRQTHSAALDDYNLPLQADELLYHPDALKVLYGD